jgi:hypothetical protein
MRENCVRFREVKDVDQGYEPVGNSGPERGCSIIGKPISYIPQDHDLCSHNHENLKSPCSVFCVLKIMVYIIYLLVIEAE